MGNTALRSCCGKEIGELIDLRITKSSRYQAMRVSKMLQRLQHSVWIFLDDGDFKEDEQFLGDGP